MEKSTIIKIICPIVTFFIIILIILLFIFIQRKENDPNRERIIQLFGENKEIKGEYNKNLSITCDNGIFVGIKKDNVLSFKGIPYAKPPVGNLRWKEPIIAENSSKVFQAYHFGKSPIQTEISSELGSYYPKSEDCLTLNIWLNTKDASRNKTVMVFIHGGAYAWGGTSDPLYDGHNLVNKFSDIILVTIEYRLGIFGFIDFSSLDEKEEYKSSSNLGLLDQICALKWTKNNINNFGGDPDKITIFGESAGAGSVSLLPLISEADGLFKRIIAESGSINFSFSPDETKRLTQLLLEESGKSNIQEIVSISEEKMKEMNEKLNDYNNCPKRDDYLLKGDLYDSYKSGKGKNIDMLLGTNKDELRYWINEMEGYIGSLSGLFIYKHLIPILYENNLKRLNDEEKKNVDKFMELQEGENIWKITEFYNELVFRIPMNKIAEYHSDNGGNTYVYHWKYPGEDEIFGACHAIELSYVFNNPQESIYTGNKYNYELADEVQVMWVNFARTGNPSTSKHTWEKYNSETRKSMILDGNIQMVEDYKKKQRLLIEPLLKYYFNGNYSKLSLNVPHYYKIIALIVGTLLIIIAAIIIIEIIIIKIYKRYRKVKEKMKEQNIENGLKLIDIKSD